MLVGTCNDLEKLQDFESGALYSRFSHELHCSRQSKEVVLRILLDEVATSYANGNPEWAHAVLEFAWDELGETDGRKILSHLSGRDRLLDGSWQLDRRATTKATLSFA